MLEDYRSYLTNVRNNLIQCGVEFPINPLNTYSELFYLGLQLDEVLWYYHILAVSGSEEALVGCMFSLRGYYKEKMRQIFYGEFRDFLQDYKKISTMYSLLQGYKSNDKEISFDEEIDLFEDEEVTENKTIEEPLIQETKSQEVLSPSSFLSMVSKTPKKEVVVEEDFVPTECDEYVSHGIYLDEPIIPKGNPEVEYVSHGVYLDELWEEDNIESAFEDPEEDDIVSAFEEEEDIEDAFEDPDEDEIKYDENGFEISDEDEVEYDENGFEIEDEEDTDVDYDENGFEVSNEEGIDVEYDENGFEIEDEEDSVKYDENGFEIEEDDVEYDENGFEVEDDEDDNGFEEPEDDGVEYDENGFEIEYDENGFEVEDDNDFEEPEDDDIEYDENGFEIESDDNFEEPEEGEDDFEFEDEEEPVIPEPQVPLQPRVSPTKEKDITDYIQDAVNATLTKGKRIIYKEIKKIKELNDE